MIQHIALTVNDPEDIEKFYEEILLFRLEHKFIMEPYTSKEIFNITSSIDVYLLEYQDMQLEVFLNAGKEKHIFSHICLRYNNSAGIYKNAVAGGYRTIKRVRENHETYFIWDKSSNMFEIKEMEEC